LEKKILAVFFEAKRKQFPPKKQVFVARFKYFFSSLFFCTVYMYYKRAYNFKRKKIALKISS